MTQGLPTRPLPAWLTGTRLPDPFPVRQALSGSLYYPACGLDGEPVKHLAGLVHSFVYVDYGRDREQVISSLENPGTSFRGYRLADFRDLAERDLVPNGWEPHPPERRLDGNPERGRPFARKPFSAWFLLEREKEFGPDHGPERFCLLYVCADGSAAFQALYHGNCCAPEVIALINPGLGFGGNWTNFRDPSQVLGRSVLHNPHGKPGYLLCQGAVPCWPDYSQPVTGWETPSGPLTLWGR